MRESGVQVVRARILYTTVSCWSASPEEYVLDRLPSMHLSVAQSEYNAACSGYCNQAPNNTDSAYASAWKDSKHIGGDCI